MIEVDAVFYSVPPALAGQVVEVRLPIEGRIIEVRHRVLIRSPLEGRRRCGIPPTAAGWRSWR
jgi:hypothetical protein